MTYALGIDVGTTYSAAGTVERGQVETVSLGADRVAIPSVVFATGDGFLFGDAAARRGTADGDGLAREFKRRLGDPVPIILSGSPYHADRLTALMTRWLFDAVVAQKGGLPDSVTVTHPANWTTFQLELLRKALADVGMEDVGLLTEPAAAALDYASAAVIESGALVLVYDLGGGTFDVALLRREGDGFVHEIDPFGIERLGGIDFDEAVLRFVLDYVPPEVLDSARTTPEGRAALAAVRRVCVDAKEALSSDTRADVPVILPGHSSTVRITRAEFERMIRPMVRQTTDGIRDTLGRAGIEPDALHVALLVGGSSRIPLIPQMVSQELGLAVRVDAHPKLVVARGGARHAAMSPPTPSRSTGPGARTDAAAGGRRRLAIGVFGVVAAAVAGGVWAAASGAGDDDPGTAGEPSSVAVTSSTPRAGSPSTGAPTSPPSTAGPSTIAARAAPVAPVEEFETNGLPLSIEVVGDDLWVTSVTTGTLQRFDLTQSPIALADDIDLGYSEPFHIRGQDIIPQGSALYVTQHEGGTVARLDVATGAFERLPVGGQPNDGTLLGDTVWVSVVPFGDSAAAASTSPDANTTPQLVPIVESTVGTPLPMDSPTGSLEVLDGALWAVFYSDGRIGRVDTATGEVSSVEIPGSPSDILAVDGQLWVVVRDIDSVVVVDPDEMRVVDTIEVGANPHKLVAGLGSVWVTNEGDAKVPGTVSRIDPETRDAVQAPIEVGLAPIEPSASDDRVFVANYNGRTLGGDGPGTVTVLASD